MAGKSPGFGVGWAREKTLALQLITSGHFCFPGAMLTPKSLKKNEEQYSETPMERVLFFERFT